MCTVVVDVAADAIRLLAVRDEDPHRPWDSWGEWWPETFADVWGVRDREAGGAWMAANMVDPRVAVVVNRATTISTTDTVPLQSRGSLALESVWGRSPQPPLHMHGFHLLEATPDAARILTWDGGDLVETVIPEGVHMLAHDDLDDARTPRITAWLHRFRADKDRLGDMWSNDWHVAWEHTLQESTEVPPTDDRAIIRDNRPHGYPTQSLVYVFAEITANGVSVREQILPRPGHWG
ncbi:NRDE family protein [Microbacterium sp. YY-01]|uniref:NRDE family protein n=1 Tax=Microbacterium sp. YY-01 TaxID=3421634 RepID=UPI003D181F3B